MGELVFAAAMSHAPGIAAFPEAASEVERAGFFDATEELRNGLDAAKPDVVIFLAPDHFSNFFTDNMPAFCIGTNEVYEGPVEEWLRMPRSKIPGASAFAGELLEVTMDKGFDPSFSRGLKLDHSVMVPMQLLRPEYDIPILWIMTNCQSPPLPTVRRCYEFGQALRAVVAKRKERVAVIGTGGLSHAPGAAEAGMIDADFDREFLALLDSDSPTAILDIPPGRVDSAGFGTWEIRLWAMVLGAANGQRAHTLSYAPVTAWETGCAVSQFDLAYRGA